MRALILLTVVLCLPGCGSVMTLARSDQKVQASLAENRTRCESLPYVFSGVGYDLCKLHAEPKYMESRSNVFELYALDLVLSGVVDVFALPFTIPKQINNGSLPL